MQLHEYNCECCNTVVLVDAPDMGYHTEHGLCGECYHNPNVDECKVITSSGNEFETPVDKTNVENSSNPFLRELQEKGISYKVYTFEVPPPEGQLIFQFDI